MTDIDKLLSALARLVSYQREVSLTDFEVTLLWWTGGFDADRAQVRITASLASRTWGHVLATYLALMAFSGLLGVLATNDRSLPQFCALLAVELALAGFIGLAHLVYVEPHQIRRRVERLAADFPVGA